jgi:hypothetical protein
MPKVDVGENCTADSDCNTGNCSAIDGVCRTPVGQSCTPDNCDQCYSSGTFSYCGGSCTTSSMCNGGYCLGLTPDSTGISIAYNCYPPCTTGCTVGCQSVLVDNGGYTTTVDYCNILSLTPATGLSRLGYACGGGCTDGTCYKSWTNVCTKACATSADCGAGFACVDLPCDSADGGAAADAGTCPVCMATCTDEAGSCHRGTCTSEATVDGTSTMLCDPRGSIGDACASDVECQSGRCVATRCASAAGAANGDGCTTNADCVSNNCPAGQCKGTALLGASCNVSADCAVGSCCTSGALANTCETSCM